MNNIEIYYYSGTGNSLHVARELKTRVPQIELIPMVAQLNKDVIKSGAERVGFIYPVNLSTVPAIVRSFLCKTDVKSARYVFAVATRCGYPGPCPPHIAIERILKKKGQKLDLYFMLSMADNSPTGLKPSFSASNREWVHQISTENVAKLETGVQDKLDVIARAIVAREKYCQRDSGRKSDSFIDNMASRLIEYATEHGNTEINFYADGQCSGCGICEKVCLSSKIKMENGRPLWQKEVGCFHCYACFNFCPLQSVLIRNSKNSYTGKDGRYHHPSVTADDIAGQKACR